MMAEGGDKPHTPKPELDALFQRVGSKLGWFQFKDVDTAIKTLSKSGKKKSARSRIHASDSVVNDRSKVTASKNSSTRSTSKKSKNPSKLSLRKERLPHQEQENQNPTKGDYLLDLPEKKGRKRTPQSSPDYDSTENAECPLVESTRIGSRIFSSGNETFVNLSLSPVRFALSSFNTGHVFTDGSELGESYEDLDIRKDGEDNTSLSNVTTNKHYATCNPGDEDVFYSILESQDSPKVASIDHAQQKLKCKKKSLMSNDVNKPEESSGESMDRNKETSSGESEKSSDRSDYYEVEDKAVSTGSLEIQIAEEGSNRSYENDRTYFGSWSILPGSTKKNKIAKTNDDGRSFAGLIQVDEGEEQRRLDKKADNQKNCSKVLDIENRNGASSMSALSNISTSDLFELNSDPNSDSLTEMANIGKTDSELGQSNLEIGHSVSELGHDESDSPQDDDFCYVDDKCSGTGVSLGKSFDSGSISTSIPLFDRLVNETRYFDSKDRLSVSKVDESSSCPVDSQPDQTMYYDVEESLAGTEQKFKSLKLDRNSGPNLDTDKNASNSDRKFKFSRNLEKTQDTKDQVSASDSGKGKDVAVLLDDSLPELNVPDIEVEIVHSSYESLPYIQPGTDNVDSDKGQSVRSKLPVPTLPEPANSSSSHRRQRKYSTESSDDDLESFFSRVKTPLRQRLTVSDSSNKASASDRDSMDDFVVDDDDVTSDDNSDDDSLFYIQTNRKIEPPSSAPPKSKTHARPPRDVVEIDSDSDEENFPILKPKPASKPTFKTPKPVTKPKSTPSSAKIKSNVPSTPSSLHAPSFIHTPSTSHTSSSSHTLSSTSFLQSLSSNIPDSRKHPEALRFSRQFSKLKEELMRKLFLLYNSTVFDNKLPSDLLMKWNARLLKTAGYCRYKRAREPNSAVGRSVEIELSTKVCDCTERVRDTLIHELCHAAVWLINGTRDGHGPYWKYWAKKSNLVHPELPVINRCHNYSINTKYIYKCVRCSYQIGRHSKSLDTDKKVCGLCHGKFELLLSEKSSKSSESGPVTPRTPRTPNKFALFVKENYKNVKQRNSDFKHKDVMAVLSSDFAEKNKIKET